MVDALPYLADYPYGCTEQTLNRFLPTVITQKMLLEMKLDLKAIREKRTNLNAQEIGDDRRTRQGSGSGSTAIRSSTKDELNRMVKEGVTALTEHAAQRRRLGLVQRLWGEHSWPHTTAVVVHGLQIAKAKRRGPRPRRAGTRRRVAEELSGRSKCDGSRTPPGKNEAVEGARRRSRRLRLHGPGRCRRSDNVEMRDFLYRDRIELAVYAKAMFGLALHKLGEQEKLDMIMQNIEQFLVQDDENETAYLKLPENNYWWYWYGSETRRTPTTSSCSPRSTPRARAPRLVKYLLNNRKHATYWNRAPATRRCASKRSPTTSRPAARTSPT